ncbi:MAG: hypothetical protein M3P12_12940 [Gemmatimonadota bacterium]|nr:hypothetical protein [Gemmatimonadota bacterium]
MSLPLQTSNPAPTNQLYRLTAKELRLRSYFVAAFNDAPKPEWAMQHVIRDLTDEMKSAGESVETVIKRVKYIAAIPIAFHYRYGYDDAHSRLMHTVSKATSFCIERYYDGGE